MISRGGVGLIVTAMGASSGMILMPLCVGLRLIRVTPESNVIVIPRYRHLQGHFAVTRPHEVVSQDGLKGDFVRLRFWLCALILALFSLALAAQDTRQVSEPKIPPACSTLEAAIAAKSGVLLETDELRTDTQRIQSAIDGCTAGKAVVLQVHGDRSVFLSGPLTLKSGVTLVVSANTVLAASRDPRAFDITPGSCGIVSSKGHGCRGLITVTKTTGSGIMGDGGHRWARRRQPAGPEGELVGSCPRGKGHRSSTKRSMDDHGERIQGVHALSDHAAELSGLFTYL